MRADTNTAVTSVLSVDEARALTERIRQTGAVLWAQIVKAYQGRAWLALGYDSWDSYCDAEFDGCRLRLPREDRREVVASLAEQGMSTRAIAAATGINRETVRQELAGDNFLPPAPRQPPVPTGDDEPVGTPLESNPHDSGSVVDDDIVDAEIVEFPRNRIIGLDGKSYARPVPVPSSSAVADDDARPIRPDRNGRPGDRIAYYLKTRKAEDSSNRIVTVTVENAINGDVCLDLIDYAALDEVLFDDWIVSLTCGAAAFNKLRRALIAERQRRAGLK